MQTGGPVGGLSWALPGHRAAPPAKETPESPHPTCGCGSLGGVRGHLHRDFVLTSPQGTGSSQMNYTYLYINTWLFYRLQWSLFPQGQPWRSQLYWGVQTSPTVLSLLLGEGSGVLLRAQQGTELTSRPKAVPHAVRRPGVLPFPWELSFLLKMNLQPALPEGP